MRHVDVLAPHRSPIVVVMGPRMRCSVEDRDLIEYAMFDLKALGRPVTFRVSGMIAGPEDFAECLAPPLGFSVEVFGTAPENRARRMCKHDDYERDAVSLIEAHSLWVFPTAYQLRSPEFIEDMEFVEVAQELQVPVFLFLPKEYNYELVEYT
jgi:hypothetical protein